MSVGFILLMLTGAGASDHLVAATTTTPTEAQVSQESYTNYTQAYHAAQKSKCPMLVILNPGKTSKGCWSPWKT